MKRNFLQFVCVTCAVVSVSCFAEDSERVQHFKGKMPHTVEEAKSLLSEYNARLAAVLASEKLTIDDLGNIHELTYTLENALGKIKTDLDALSDRLEALHQASETARLQETKALGAQYLESSRKLLD